MCGKESVCVGVCGKESVCVGVCGKESVCVGVCGKVSVCEKRRKINKHMLSINQGNRYSHAMMNIFD